jgi:hypothetical protein
MDIAEDATMRCFKISKKPLSGTYHFTPDTKTTFGTFSLDVKPRTSPKLPFMVLFDDACKRTVGTVQRPMNSSVFEIKLASTDQRNNEGEKKLTTLQHTDNKEACWSSTSLFGKQDFVWKGALGIRGICYKLTGSNPDYVLAEFRSTKGFAACGVLHFNVDYGVEFDREVIMTLMCLYDRISVRGTNAIGWGANGFGGDC